MASDTPADVGLVLLNARKECSLAQPVDSLETFLKVAELEAVGSGAAIALIGLEDFGLSIFRNSVELFLGSDLVHRVPDAVENVADGDAIGVLDDDAPASVAGDELDAALEGLSGRDGEVFGEWECGAFCSWDVSLGGLDADVEDDVEAALAAEEELVEEAVNVARWRSKQKRGRV